VLRALKDLQTEHDLGKIDDEDYDTIAARYREDAKTVMKEMDHQAAPARAEAERLAAEFLLRRRSTGTSRTQEATPRARPTRDAKRIPCSGCGASNEPDATFCKRCGTALTRATGEGDEGP
jgi:ribosomal protein L40E